MNSHAGYLNHLYLEKYPLLWTVSEVVAVGALPFKVFTSQITFVLVRRRSMRNIHVWFSYAGPGIGVCTISNDVNRRNSHNEV